MINNLYRKFVFNVQGNNKMKSMRKKLFNESLLLLGICAGWAVIGHYLKPWAVAHLLASAYVVGLFLIWAKTR